jgi:hypothetical protein
MEYKLVKKRDEDDNKQDEIQNVEVSDEIDIELLSVNISNTKNYQIIPNSSSTILDNSNTVEISTFSLSKHKLSIFFSIICIILVLTIIYQYKIIYKESNILNNSFYATKIAFGSCTAYDLRQMFIWEGITNFLVYF